MSHRGFLPDDDRSGRICPISISVARCETHRCRRAPKITPKIQDSLNGQINII